TIPCLPLASAAAPSLSVWLEPHPIDSQHLQLKALQTLSSITTLSPHNRTSAAQTPTCVATLLALASSSNPAIQWRIQKNKLVGHPLPLSLSTLSLNPDLKLSLADTQTIRRLNSAISSPATAPKSLRIASALICSLPMLDKNKAKFGLAGTVQILVKAVSGPQPSNHLVSTLSELVQFHGNCTLAVRILTQLVSKNEAEGDLAGAALTILALLSRFNEGLSELKRADGIVESMVRVLRGRCTVSKDGAAEILLRLFNEGEKRLRDAVHAADLLPAVADVSGRLEQGTREKAGLLMAKMMNLDYFQF
uniref:ARM repeat superfamily protein n=1 Tax=Kalanchoe fedtschenkoi TaxID=63787 RepID=A0A7N0UTG2_KALFE